MTTSHARFTLSLLLAAFASLPVVAYGRGIALASDASAAQAIAHTEAWIKANPKDTAGYRALAHLHALAWAYGETIPLADTLRPDSLPLFTEKTTVLVSRTASRESLLWWNSKAVPAGDRQDRPVTADEAKHLAASIVAYRKAIELDATDALSELGLGWMLAQEGKYVRELPADHFGQHKPTDAELELQALDHYRKAYDLRAKADLAGEPTYQVDSQISAKAGVQILAVLAKHPDAAKKGEVQAVQDVLKPLAEKWGGLMARPQ